MKNQNKKKIIVLAILSIFLLTEIFPFFNESINRINQKEQNESDSEKKQLNPALGNFTYITDVDQTDYQFNAKGECYILAKINGTDFTSFQLDDEKYNVSYGLNSFPKDFGDDWGSHSITIDSSNLYNGDSNLNYEWLCVEPLYLAENYTIVNMLEETFINFDGGGPISILLQPDFLYNYLYIEILELGSKSIVLKDVFDPVNGFPEINSKDYSSFIEGGMYISFDLNLKPGTHVMKICGDGAIDYKIMVNLDWDDDLLGDVEEIQQSHLHRLDPTIPNCWGYFEKSENLMVGYSDGFAEGHYRFYIPQSCVDPLYLSIDMKEGEFSNFIIDDDDLTFKDMKFSLNPYTSEGHTRFYGNIEPGIHDIYYQYNCNISAVIFFRLNSETIITLDFSSTLDTDGDGVKDYAEYKFGSNPYKIDTDNDKLPDIFDASPLTSLVLNKDKMGQIVLPHNPSKNSIINMIINKPSIDYTTYYDTRLWNNGLNVSLYFVMRLFGNETITRNEVVSFWKYDSNNIESYSLVDGYNCLGYGDAIPDKSNPNAELTFILPKPSLETFEFDLIFPVGHPAKVDDNAIDLRFDFVWLISYYNETSKNSKIIHYYDIEEDIIIQSLVSREIDNVSYILGSPESMIEHQVLWSLTQNSQLTLLGDYDPYSDDDIVGFGSIDYLNLTYQLIEDRKNHPLLGYYNATYNFEGEIDGTSGTLIDFIDDVQGTDCTIDIISEFKGHTKVLRSHDTNSASCSGIHEFDEGAQQYGSIEFWWSTTDSTQNTNFQPRDASNNILFRLRIKNDILEFYDGSWHTIISSWNVDNEWHHYRVDFERTSGEYKGLLQNRWQVYVDGKKYGPFNFETSINPDRIWLNNGDAENFVYYDAFGFNWDENYELEDNQKINPLENEVLYIAGLTSNYDILNKINIKENIPNPSFEVNYSGHYQTYFSLNSINNDGSEVSGSIYDLKTLSEQNTIGYEIFWHNFSSDGIRKHEQRTDLEGFPIFVEVKDFETASILDITNIHGDAIPLDQIPYSINDNLYSKIILENKTYIEKHDEEFSSSTIRFQIDDDIVKDTIDYRFDEVIRANLFFELDTEIYIENFKDYLKLIFKFFQTIDDIELDIIKVSLEHFLEKFKALDDKFATLLKDFSLHCANEYNRDIYWKSKEITEFFESIGEENYDLMLEIASKIEDWNEEVGKKISSTTTAALKKIKLLKSAMKDIKAQAEIKFKWLKWNKLRAKIWGIRIGKCIGAILSLINMGYYIFEIWTLFAESDEYWDSEIGIVAFFTRLIVGCGGVLLSVFSIIKLTKLAALDCFSWLGKAVSILGFVIKVVKMIGDIFYALSIFDENPALALNIIITSLVTTSIMIGVDILLLMAGASSWVTAGISFIVALVITLILIFIPPMSTSFTTVMDDSYLTIPTDDIKRHGGFEVGDTVGFTIAFLNNGQYSLKAQGKFRLFDGSGEEIGEWSEYQGNWVDDLTTTYQFVPYPPYVITYCIFLTKYSAGDTWKYEFERTILTPMVNLTGEYEMMADSIQPSVGTEIRIRVYGPESSLIPFNTPVLENNIADFYENTVPLATINSLLELQLMLETAMEQYQWKDASDLLDSIQDIEPEYGQDINIPVNTNIATNLRDDIVVMDPDTDIAVFEFNLILDDIDSTVVNYSFIVPDGFSITSSEITQALDLDVNFNISANDPYEFPGIYYIDMNITLSTNNVRVYFEQIPFRIPIIENIQIDQKNIIFEDKDIFGNYTATYDWLDDTVGSTPDGWTVYEEGGTVNVHTGKENHNMIAEFHDIQSLGSFCGMSNTFSEQISGSIEFWLYHTDVEKDFRFFLLDSSTNAVVKIGSEDGFFKYYYWDGISEKQSNITRISQNTWHHLKLNFDCLTNIYTFYIDGIKYHVGEMIYTSNIAEFMISSLSDLGDSSYNFKFYIDAIGYSWDSNYKNGDNRYNTMFTTDVYDSTTELKKGDVLNIEYGTSSLNEITIDLLTNDTIQGSYSIVPRGNLYQGIQFNQIIIKNDISFDEIKFNILDHSYFNINQISIIDATSSISQYFNPINITNIGNVPEFVAFSFSGVPFDNVNQSLHLDEFFGDKQIITLLPNTFRVCEFDIKIPSESISNLLWRGIAYSKCGTNEIYNLYMDNLEFDGIYIVSPQNITHYVKGKASTCENNEFHLDTIPEEELEWSAYSLNGQANVTFSETANITLPNPSGAYTIQVFGRNTQGTMFQSEARYFTLLYPEITILNPENITYHFGEDGNYPGTFTFDNEIDEDLFIDTDNSGWQFGEIDIVDNVGDHNGVLRFEDDSYFITFDIENNFESAQNYGTIEFYVRTTNKNNRFVFQPKNSNQILLGYRIDDGYHQSYIGGTGWGNVIPASNNQWYHIRIDFTTEGSYNGLTENSWKLYIDEVGYGPFNLETNDISIDRLRIASCSNDYNYYCYLDAVGYSWDEGYAVGDNLKMGLHLNYIFDTDIELDLITYSLDGGNNIPISSFGKTLIPLRSLGVHSIQLYGIDSDGINYQSDLRYFTHLGVLNKTPTQPGDFVITKGTFQTPYGDLELIDDDYTTIHALEEQSGTYIFLGYLKPNGDIYYNWVDGDGTPHSTKLDEAVHPTDPTQLYDLNGDGGNIREDHENAKDRWDFTSLTIPTGYHVSKVIMKGYVTKQTSACTAWISVGSTAGSSTWFPSTSGTTYAWKSITKTGLNLDQAALDSFKITVDPSNIPPNIPERVHGWVDIEAVYVEVYISSNPTYDLDVQVDIKVDDLDCSEIISLEYSYKTDVSTTIDFDIWNWDTQQWIQIESVNNYNSFDDDTFILGKESEYVSDEFEVRVRFQSFDQQNDFDLQIDRLRVDYITV